MFLLDIYNYMSSKLPRDLDPANPQRLLANNASSVPELALVNVISMVSDLMMVNGT